MEQNGEITGLSIRQAPTGLGDATDMNAVKANDSTDRGRGGARGFTLMAAVVEEYRLAPGPPQDLPR